MFTANSRYAQAGTITVRTSRGETIVAARLPIREPGEVHAVHQRTEGQRLDHIAQHYLTDATAFWQLCDASDALAPDALSARDHILISSGERPA
jgi:hypothetical protein